MREAMVVREVRDRDDTPYDGKLYLFGGPNEAAGAVQALQLSGHRARWARREVRMDGVTGYVYVVRLELEENP